jgi:sarcosine oxidase subunit beta
MTGKYSGTIAHMSTWRPGERVEVVIIGGGVMGASLAFHLARRGCRDVLLLEREGFLGAGSTGRGAGGVRHQFSSPVNIELSRLSIRAVERFADEVGAPLDFRQDGYLFLLTREADWAEFRRAAALQRSLGVPVETLTAREAARLVPGLYVDDVLGATFCAKDGIADPHGMTQGYAGAARRLGARIETGVAVTGVRVEPTPPPREAPLRGDPGVGAGGAAVGRRVTGVETSAGPVAARWVVNCAGPWAAEVGRMAGVDVPVTPIRRHIFTTRPFAGAPARSTMVVDFATTFYFHRESGGVLMGMARDEPPGYDTSVDPAFQYAVLERALERYPPIAEAAIAKAWAGLYEVSPDAHPILGPVPGLSGFLLANGFSGHGFQHAPAVGLLLAEVILDGAARTIDIAPLAYDRFIRSASTPGGVAPWTPERYVV